MGKLICPSIYQMPFGNSGSKTTMPVPRVSIFIFLTFKLAAEDNDYVAPETNLRNGKTPRAIDILDKEKLIQPEPRIAKIQMTEVQMVNQFKGSKKLPPQFTRGYGLTFGYNERKAMSMALVDRSLYFRTIFSSGTR